MMGGMLLVAIKWMAISPAEVLILLVLFARVLPRIRSMQTSYRGFVALLPGFATVTRIEEQCRAAAEPDRDAGQPMEFRSALRFENVSFTYPPNATPVLRGIDLTISVGRTVAIVGPRAPGRARSLISSWA